jgi:hypothetical protein
MFIMMYVLLVAFFLTGCLGSFSVKELDAEVCGPLDAKECELQRAKKEDEEVAT